jgi:bifunctional UDP-N-acetylglucosamine pyrophosphorylase/glucosamine-1-phosphate N-acetyltransferase
MNRIGVILLAAGLGKRMRSSLPKVLHPLGGKPLLSHGLKTVRGLSPEKIVVVVGHKAEEVKRRCAGDGIVWAYQDEQLGSGHAALCARAELADFSGDLLILSGDVPLITRETLGRLIDRHRGERAAVTLLTAVLDEPRGYGRIIRGPRGRVSGIVEEADAGEAERQIREINAGIYAASPRFLFPALQEATPANQQGEYYLTEIAAMACRKGEIVESVQSDNPAEIMGINTREELATMERLLRQRINRKWMEAGVTLLDPDTTYIDEEVEIGRDTVIGPNTHLKGRTRVGERCVIEGSAYVTDARLGDEARLKFSVVLSECEVGEAAQVGPFAHLRPGAVLKRNVHIGSFVEVKNSVVDEGTKANHLSYLGDAVLGKETNIGAGTITCNYDGFEKHRTVIGDRVQIGSNTQLVAPIVIGDDAYIGAGSTITKDVPSGALALSRVPQKHIEGWVERFRARHEKDS